ncbi:hypothetical protein TNCV_693951 [Trichonephila clavipes]|nr:hypothetical protein TNCV_693951 [Trichonephila clavipes]
MRIRNYYAHPNIRDHWALRCMSRCPDLVICLKRDLQCLRPEVSLVLIYRPNVAGMKGRVDFAQIVNRTQDLCTNPPTGQHGFFCPTREASKTDHTDFFPDGHGYGLVSSVRALVPQKFSVEEELMHVKHVEIKSPHVGVMWKFGRGVISSGIVLVT